MGGVLTAAGEFETEPCYKGKRPSRKCPVTYSKAKAAFEPRFGLENMAE